MSKHEERIQKINELLKNKNINFQQVVELEIEKRHLIEKLKQSHVDQYHTDRNNSDYAAKTAH